MDSANENETDLVLLAFCYVSGEMADEEYALFEKRLEDDQQAREAVARAVQVGQAVVSLGSERSPVRSQKVTVQTAQGVTELKSRLWGAVVVATAVAFLAGIAISQWFDSQWFDSQWFDLGTRSPSRDMSARNEDAADRPARLDPREGDADELLALWSASETEFGRLFDELTAEASANGSAGILPETEFVVPSWMLAAVSPDGESENDESETGPPDKTPEEN